VTVADYTDWIRTTQSSAPPLLNAVTVIPVTQTFGPFPVGQWSAVAIQLELSAGAAAIGRVTVQWYADAALTIPLTFVDYWLGNNDTAYETIPTRGQYFTVVVTTEHGAGPFSYTTVVTPVANLFSPRDGVDNLALFLGATAAFATGTSLATPMGILSTGPCNVTVTGTGAARVLVQGLKFNNTLDVIYGSAQTAVAGAWVMTVPCLMGRKSPQIVMFNDSGGNQAYNLGFAYAA